MKIKNICLFLFFIISAWAITLNKVQAQQKSLLGLSKKDSIRQLYIENYDNDIIVKTFGAYRQLSINFSPQKIRNIDLQYLPNVASTGGFGIVFKRIALNVGFKLRQDENATRNRGQSQYLDLQLNSFGKKIGYDLYYQNYQGYYINNPAVVFGQWTNATLPQRPDMRIQNIAANVSYFFNHRKFSYRSVFVFDERQIKPAGSFILTASIGYLNLSADSSFIPQNRVIPFENNSDFNQAKFYTFAFAPGYGYNLILFKSVFLSASISTNLGIQIHQYGLNQTDRSFANSLFKLLGRASIGYSSQRFFAAGYFQFDTNNLSTEQVNVSTTVLNFGILAGYRFRTKLLNNFSIF
ncbi:MAG: DUF4421 domain-containing protein [Cytophagales bacterium]|nr:MAG: DUF4421 domain-containing protein [Cytophagales bacterium]